MISPKNSASGVGQRVRALASDSHIWLFIGAVTLGMTFIMAFNLVADSQVSVSFEQPAGEDIFAPRSLTYTSSYLTEQARNLARASVADVYTPLDLSIGRTQLAQVQDVFAFVDTVRADSVATVEEKLDYLQAIDGLTIDDQIGLTLLELSDADYLEVRQDILRIVNELMREEIRAATLADVQRAARRQASLELSAAQSSVVTSLAQQFIVETVFADPEETERRHDEAAEAVEPVSRSVVEGQRVVRSGEMVTQADIEMLTELGLLQQDPHWQDLLSILLASLLAAVVIAMYWRQFHRSLQANRRYLAVLGGLMLLFTLGAQLMTTASITALAYWFPLASFSILLAVVYDVPMAIVATAVMAGVTGYISDSLELALYVSAGGIVAALTLRHAQRVTAFFRGGLAAALGYVLVVMIFRLPQEVDTVALVTQTLYGLGNGLLSAALALAILYFLGSVFGIITILQLQDLSRLDHPLLKELLRRAPGTYHHSIMVANLAEQAAESVRANAALVRVGAFYHDIGKMNRPPFFTENQEGLNPHETLDPRTSARIIISHVTDGLELAKRYRLPDRIRDFIAEHHGDRVVKSFYHKAREKAGENADAVDIKDFKYPGPRPRSRETGIVLLADAVEATSTALHPNSAPAIEKLVNSLVEGDILDGQLNFSGLTLDDLVKIRTSFIETLKGRFHVRVRYPGNELLEAAPTLIASEPDANDLAPAQLPARADSAALEEEPVVPGRRAEPAKVIAAEAGQATVRPSEAGD